MDATDYETPAQTVARLRYNGEIAPEVCGAAYPLFLDGDLVYCDQNVDHAGAHQAGAEDGVREFEDQPECWLPRVCPVHGVSCVVWA